jgi:hypothetical protein
MMSDNSASPMGVISDPRLKEDNKDVQKMQELFDKE